MKAAVAISIFFIGTAVQGQITHPKASPYSEITQYIGLTKVTVAYSRPAARGRNVMGELVPYGRIWRVGANESTKFSVDREVSVLGHPIPAGTYALYAFPEASEWDVVFHTNTSHWGDGRKAYNPEEDLFRVRITPEKIPIKQENFLISFDALDHNSATMIWQWEHTRLSIPIEVDTRGQMLSEIESKLNSHPTAQTYYEAARYFQEQGIHQQRGLQYVNKAIDLGGDTYYHYRVKSLLEAALGDFQAAIASARRSRDLAALEEKDEFVRMNRKNIALWERKLKSKRQ